MYRQIYNKILSRPIIVLGIVQLILLVLVFNKIIFEPNAYMYTNVYDGLKNYFTFTQFIAQDSSELGPWHFTQMNYPFGEYVFFTDNTPLLSMPLRWVNMHLFSVEGNSVAIHNYFFLFNLLLSPLLFFKLIQAYAKDKVLFAILLAIAFSWLNPQILKLLYGVYNLSLSVVLLAMLLLLEKIYSYWQSPNKKDFIQLNLAIFTLIFIAAFAHIYYIPVLALPLGIYVLTLSLIEWFKTKNWKWKPVLGFGLSALIGGLSFYLLIQFIDTYADLRRATASGFDWIEWKFTPEAIFTPYRYNELYPLVKSCKSANDIPSESHGFWGNFTWAVLALSGLYLAYLVFIAKQSLKTIFQGIFKHSYLLALCVTAFFTYSTAAGVYLKFCVVPLSLDNVFSPFYYLYEHIDLITQFRCLGRFSWMGFWIVSFLVSVLFFKLYDSVKQRKTCLGIILAIFLLFILIWDTKDAMRYQSEVYAVNVFEEKVLEEKFEVLGDAIDFESFQAIYTIPAVQVGSEDYNITIDDQKEWTTYWMQLSAYSKLPLFNCKMSRTAENQAKAQVDLLLNQKVPVLILDKLNNQPILVVYSAKHEDNFDLKVLDYARPAVENGSEIIKAFQMDTILVENQVYYLSWDINKQH